MVLYNLFLSAFFIFRPQNRFDSLEMLSREVPLYTRIVIMSVMRCSVMYIHSHNKHVTTRLAETAKGTKMTGVAASGACLQS